MSTRVIAAVAAVFVLALAAWLFRDSDTVRSAAGGVAEFAKSIVPDNSYSTTKPNADKSAGKADGAKGAHSLRKCVSETRTVYTDEACPPGSREAPISEGNVTVVPGQRSAEKPKGDEKAK
jgi:hypothetical protein